MSKARSYRLYIVGDIDNKESSVLVDNLKQGLSDRYGEDCELDVKTLFHNDNARQAINDGVFSVPTLLRQFPNPVKQRIGGLLNAHKTLSLLDNGEVAV